MKRILIFDKDQCVLEILKDALEYSKFDVLAKIDATDFELIIDAYKPDVILMDYLLGKVNGGEICHLIKHNSKISHLPVIIISCYPRMMQSPAIDDCDIFIEKPFDLKELIDQINKCIVAANLRNNENWNLL